MNPIDELSDETRAGRRAVARLVEEGPAHFDSLLEVLERSTSPLARSRAALILGKIGDARAVEPLARAIPSVGHRAVQALRRLGALSRLIRALDENDEDHRVLIVSQLAERETEESNAAIEARLDDPAERVRATAVHALVTLGRPIPVPRLLALLSGATLQLRYAVSEALARQGAWDAGVSHPDPDVRVHVLRHVPRDVALRALDELRTEPAEEDDAPVELRRRAVEALAFSPDLRLLMYLNDDDRAVRASAVLGLTRLKDPAAFQPLCRALKDPEESVRGFAARALGELGDRRAFALLAEALHDAPEWAASALVRLDRERGVATLLEAFSTGRAEVRRAAFYTLRRIEAAQATVLQQALRDKDPGIREVARFEELRQAGVDVWLDALESRDRWHFAAVAEWLGRSGDSRAVEPLMRAVADPSQPRRFEAAIALGRLGDVRAVPVLIEVARNAEPVHPRPDTRAAWALGRIGEARAREPIEDCLREALHNDDVEAAAVFAESLGRLGDVRALDSLSFALPSEAAPVREAAARALGRLRDRKAQESLIARLEDGVASVRHAAAKALGACGGAEATKALVHHATQDVALVRRAALRSLAATGGAAAARTLIRALPNESRITRRIIVRGIQRLGEDALEELTEGARDEKSPYRRLLVSLLGRIADARVIEPLVALLQDDDWRVRARAADSLRGRDDPRAREALNRATTDVSEPVRMAAAG